MDLIHQPGAEIESGEWLRRQLRDPSWTQFRSAVAFVRRPGLNQIRPEFDEFVARASAEVIAGIDNRCTSVEGLRDLLGILDRPDCGLWLFHNESPTSIFHPKVYLFSNDRSAAMLIGSSNLTAGGLATNYELGVALSLSLDNEDDANLMGDMSSLIDTWKSEDSQFVRRADADLISDLAKRGYILPEVFARTPESGDQIETSGDDSTVQGIFGTERFAPSRSGAREPATEAVQEPLPWSLQGENGHHRGYVMTLQNTDVGVGQTTPGTAQRSPEIFIPLAARDDDPDFWGWDAQYVQHPEKDHIFNREGVRIRLGGETIEATFMVNTEKRDLRVRAEEIRSAGSIGDILRVELPSSDSDYDYYVEIVPSASALHETYLALCTSIVRAPSLKQYGYY